MVTGWQHPLRGGIKINSNVVVRGKNSFLGFVARNEDGDVLEAHAFKICISNLMIAKLMDVKKAILVSVDNGWRNIICELDAKTIIHSLNGGSSENLHWSMIPMLKEILNLCNCSDNFSFVLCNNIF